jgi:hypothetical protein
MSQKRAIFIVTAMKTSNLTYFKIVAHLAVRAGTMIICHTFLARLGPCWLLLLIRLAAKFLDNVP